MLNASFQILSHSNINGFMLAIKNTDIDDELPDNFSFSFIKLDDKSGLLIELRSETHSTLNAEEWFFENIPEDILTLVRKSAEITIVDTIHNRPIRILFDGKNIKITNAFLKADV